jgi:hypothetical protein
MKAHLTERFVKAAEPDPARNIMVRDDTTPMPARTVISTAPAAPRDNTFSTPSATTATALDLNSILHRQFGPGVIGTAGPAGRPAARP